TAPGLAAADLLAFDLARIARDKTGDTQRTAQALIIFDERAGNAMADRAGLAGDTSARHVRLHVELVGELCDFERLADDHAAGLAAEELIDRTRVDRDAARAGLQVNAGGGGLAT